MQLLVGYRLQKKNNQRDKLFQLVARGLCLVHLINTCKTTGREDFLSHISDFPKCEHLCKFLFPKKSSVETSKQTKASLALLIHLEIESARKYLRTLRKQVFLDLIHSQESKYAQNPIPFFICKSTFWEMNSPFSGIKKRLEVLQRSVFLFELRHKILGSNLIRLDALRRHFSQRKKRKGKGEGEGAVSKNSFTKIKLIALASEAGDLEGWHLHCTSYCQLLTLGK